LDAIAACVIGRTSLAGRVCAVLYLAPSGRTDHVKPGTMGMSMLELRTFFAIDRPKGMILCFRGLLDVKTESAVKASERRLDMFVGLIREVTTVDQRVNVTYTVNRQITPSSSAHLTYKIDRSRLGHLIRRG